MRGEKDEKKRILFIALIMIMLSGLSITAYAGNGYSGKHQVAAKEKLCILPGKGVYTDLGRTEYYFNGKRCSASKYNKVKKGV